MKKFLLSLLAVSAFYSSHAQEAETTEVTGPWKSKGNFAVLVSQSSFSNWQAGGDNNFSGNLNLNYDLNYQKEDWTWDNKLIVNYGFTKLKGEDQKKTNDRLELNSVLGKQASNNWYYSLFLNFKTQMDRGTDKDGGYNSHFMSPAYLQIGPGMLWKKNDNLKVNIAPATSRFIFVHSHFTDFGDAFGVEKGKSMEYQLGMSINGYYKFDIMENVSAENILNLYSNYLEKPGNVVVDYQLNLVMKINKYLSTNFTFQAVYDDQAYKGFQLREVLGVGLSYNF
ncbi:MULTISPECIES: DUF3078 domain-containing protein [Myroides]|uniref:DUF3078 domain-containing protein n=1 Tax=Myroides albus TaxID=2562892 RepID=A0A6I3LKW0_9FLAO|nr:MULTISPECIES: DUF3078 domain-containing protein [Myroides]MTG97890.1 DUF3078 domain-containing protein [Myroides albus]MVX35290.1 DUF3078 domain-containing protein [Myroides sp. LoEW2-1]UVD81077.1 DUF3078 domain-containing protein [Myroides albus]